MFPCWLHAPAREQCRLPGADASDRFVICGLLVSHSLNQAQDIQYRYYMKYSECCDVCLCTGVALLNGVGHATKTKKFPIKTGVSRLLFSGQASKRRHQAIQKWLPNTRLSSYILLKFWILSLWQKPKGNLLKYQMYAVIFALGLGHVLSQ